MTDGWKKVIDWKCAEHEPTLHIHSLLFPKLPRHVLYLLRQSSLNILRGHDLDAWGAGSWLNGADEGGTLPKVL